MDGDFTEMTQSQAPVASKKTHKREISGHICTACDQCYRCKVKCTGEKPECERCRINKSACTYSKGKPLGKPKGSKNKVQRSKAGNLGSSVAQGAGETSLSASTSPVKLKRSLDDGDLPLAKRRVISKESAAGSVQSTDEPGCFSQQDNSEVYYLDPCLSSAHRVLDTSSYTNNTLSGLLQEDLVDGVHVQTIVNTPFEAKETSFETKETYTSADATLNFEDLNWFGNTDELIPSFSNPSPPIVDLGIPDVAIPESCSPELSKPPLPQSTPPRSQSLEQGTYQCFGLSCLCDPMALNIISELQFVQTSLSPLDTALILARRGFSTVSSSLSCPSCLSSSRSLFYACILIIQQVFSCYGTVKLQSQKMLDTILQEKPKSHNSIFSIGDFEVDDEDGCHGILDAIVKAEMERGKGVIGGLERWVERSGTGSPKVATLLLRTLREDIGC